MHEGWFLLLSKLYKLAVVDNCKLSTLFINNYSLEEGERKQIRNHVLLVLIMFRNKFGGQYGQPGISSKYTGLAGTIKSVAGTIKVLHSKLISKETLKLAIKKFIC